MALCSLFWSTVLLFSSGTAYDVDFHKSFNYQVSRVLLKRGVLFAPEYTGKPKKSIGEGGGAGTPALMTTPNTAF